MTPIRIVLVDDHALVRAGVRALLGTIDRFAVVGEASCGEEALELLGRLDPDILLVDIGLKDINGLELTALITERAPRARVLILSMYDNREYVSTSLRVGAAGYVLKDAPSEEIIAAVEALAVGGRFYSRAIAARLGQGGTSEQELTPRERQVLLLMAQGLNNKAMAQRLHLSVRTVETHRLSIRRKLDIQKPADLVRHAREYGWRGEDSSNV
ncbi:response regulator transcription factor [Pseudomonas oryzihabitans]|uniref:response regulator transcription factor n=1 Tax=Pseudomonas oryzihabitans TaxID=47885 RepID=UPI0028957D23|nr:response regulator transcription factor [Pseudomonas oryzihabitans]MDT3721278.1 response regulator transcription factor [Pseudomonas oryzihabitans]